jgi:hypothetical protein
MNKLENILVKHMIPAAMKIDECSLEIATKRMESALKDTPPFFEAIYSAMEEYAQQALQEHAANKEGWVRVDNPPTQNGKYLIWDNGWDEAHYKDGKWISTQPTLKSTSPLLQSRFRQELHPTHWQPLPSPPNPQP